MAEIAPDGFVHPWTRGPCPQCGNETQLTTPFRGLRRAPERVRCLHCPEIEGTSAKKAKGGP